MTDEADTSRARLEALKEFRAWKASPDNARAYAHMEATWAQAGKLAHDQDLKELTDHTLRKRPARRARVRRATWVAATTGAIGTLTAIAALLLLARPEAYATKPGEQRLIVLADGSGVRLNTDSEVTVRLERAQRRLTLQKGEVFFEVAHDATRPFIVAADAAEVRALGTRFDVRRGPAGVQVTLLEGQVRGTPRRAPPPPSSAPTSGSPSPARPSPPRRPPTPRRPPAGPPAASPSTTSRFARPSPRSTATPWSTSSCRRLRRSPPPR